MGVCINKIFHQVAVLLIILVNINFISGTYHTEKEIQKFLEGKYEVEISHHVEKVTEAVYRYQINMTDYNNERVNDFTTHYSEYVKNTYDEWFKDIDIADIKNATLKRMLKGLKLIGESALNGNDLRKLGHVKNKMINIYSATKICPYNNLNCDLETEGMEFTPDIQLRMSESRNYNELEYLWRDWHKHVGRDLFPLYPTYVELSNKFSRLNGFKDYGEYWRANYEMDSFVDELEVLWQQMLPLYQQLHSYTATRLKGLYGAQIDISDGLIPAHVFGNMWAQNWGALIDILKPFPNQPGVDITAALKEKGFDILKMFQVADEFYTSLGLPSSSMSFGKGSLIERPRNREVVCHPSAWDIGNKKDYFIKMCTELTAFDFLTVHHELGHILYYQMYKDQPSVFRNSANPGFHEALGDIISLSAESIKHLKAIGLLAKNYPDTVESDLNKLINMALTKVAFVPFGYLLDKWRWEIFAGNLTKDKWNDRFWELRKQYQLIKPPTPSTPGDFDAGAKFHVPGDSQYINYFISHVIEFQIYRNLCIVAGEYDPETKTPPLHKCDFYGSKKAGDILKKGLSLGSSKPWPEVLKILCGTEKLDAGAVLEYFEPLSDYFNMFEYN